MEDLALSNALLDGTLRRILRKTSESNEEDSDSTSPVFPSLVYDEPYKGLNRTILFRPPPTASQKRSQSPHGVPVRVHKKSLDDVITQFFSKKKKKTLLRGVSNKTSTLSRSLSWSDLHQEHTTDTVVLPKTFVYTSRVRRQSTKETCSSKADSSDQDDHEGVDSPDSIDGAVVVLDDSNSPPSVPRRHSQMINEDANLYEVPVSTKPPPKPVRKSKSANQLPKPAPRKKKQMANNEERRAVFTAQDIAIPRGSQPNVLETLTSSTPPLTGGDIGLVMINVLAIRVPQKPVQKEYDSDQEVQSTKPVSNSTPKDELFCVLSIEGKHSQFESTLQPLNPIKQAAVWDQTEPQATFYALHSQTLYTMSRKLPIANGATPTSDRTNAECIGVGMQPLQTLQPRIISESRGCIDDWSKSNEGSTDITIPLEPFGSILLKMSYTPLQPQLPVTCSGSITVTSIVGVDCVREGESCWTCCTVDIDSENFGTTSSRLGNGQHLSNGWKSEPPIEFDAKSNTSCRIQLWGFTTQETEYWFGEVYIPLAILCPSSKHFIDEHKDSRALTVIKSFERDITMPIEPKGLITIHFVLSPLEDDGINVAIRVLEESGLFEPSALAQLKFQHPDSNVVNKQPDTIYEENGDLVTNGCSVIPEKKVTISGSYDHLCSVPPNNSLSQSIMTLRRFGNLQLQVRKSYDESKHKLNTEIDPYRELEIVKVELKDTKAKLAVSVFHKEKAELKVKTLEDEVHKLKKKLKKKK